MTKIMLPIRKQLQRPEPASFVEVLGVAFQALPLLTFAGLLLGWMYMWGYLSSFGQDPRTIAGLSDYLIAILRGMSYLLIILVSGLAGILSFRKIASGLEPKKTVMYSISALIVMGFILLFSTSISFSSIFEKKDHDLGWLSGIDVGRNINEINSGSGILAYTPIMLFVSLILIATASGGVYRVWRLDRSLLYVAVTILLMCFPVCVGVISLGRVDAYGDYSRSFMVTPTGGVIYAYYTKDIEEENCQCGASVMWSGEKSTLVRCPQVNVIIHGPENVAFLTDRTTIPKGSRELNSSLTSGIVPENLEIRADLSCTIGKNAILLSKTKANGIVFRSGDTWGASLSSSDGAAKLGMTCSPGDLYANLHRGDRSAPEDWKPLEGTVLELFTIGADGKPKKIEGGKVLVENARYGVRLQFPERIPVGKVMINIEGYTFDLTALASSPGRMSCRRPD